jgi:anti-sigma factor RsiW
MVRKIDPQLERQIVRHLDGQLPPAQRSLLYRELLKNPVARQASDDYQANDALAAAALRDLLPPMDAGACAEMAARVTSAPVGTAPRRHYLARYAAAAAILVSIGAGLLALALHRNPAERRETAGGGVANQGTALPLAISPAANHGMSKGTVSGAGDESAVAPEAGADPGRRNLITVIDEKTNTFFQVEIPRESHESSVDQVSYRDF